MATCRERSCIIRRMTAAPTVDTTESLPVTRVTRVEVRPRPGEADPVGDALLSDARQAFGQVTAIHSATIYLIEAPLSDAQARRVADELLTDPVNQTATIGAASAIGPSVEVHYQPGVMDPVAQSTRDAIGEMLPEIDVASVQVRTGRRFDLEGVAPESAGTDALRAFAERHLANPVIQDIHLDRFHPEAFEHGHAYEPLVTHVPIRDLDEAGLKTLSREGHLFLSLDEMRAIQGYYQAADREPTDIELETLAQTWSEHCVHKTLKSTISYTSDIQHQTPGIDFIGRPGHEIHDDGSVTIHNLLKSTIAAATNELRQSAPHDDWLVSVFDDNAGIVKFDDTDGVCIKVETHNHPSAIEPYGGAATGIGGCIRDVMGTGLSARPIANTDVFAVAPPDFGCRISDVGEGAGTTPSETRNPQSEIPKGVIPPRRILEQVVAGVRDYGNRMGIPTLNGAVVFDGRFLGNPLVFAGCIGLIPLDKCFGDAEPGDHIVALGGATGRDGIHGATFSSAELTDTHADEFSHAVQIGNAITQKKMMDVILRARDAEGGALFRAITDCGAGGFSSAIGEMGEKVGATVHLERAPLKYVGLSYTEIWISEAQERMVLAVPPESVARLREMCEAEDVPFCDLGEFGLRQDDDPTLSLNYQGLEVGRLSMTLMHDGIPTPTREAVWPPSPSEHPVSLKRTRPEVSGLDGALTALLSHPNIASKHWIIRQYDHEVQGGSVVKPLVGPGQDGPSDAAVIRPKLDSRRGVAIANGLAPHLSEAACGPAGDSYHATLNAIDEAVRNAVCVGADPQRIAILDNFCWPSCDDPHQLGSLVRAAEACYDGAMAYRTPFVSGKDSLNNQFTTETGEVITIPQTLLVTALGIVEDTRRCVTMDAKTSGNVLLIVGETDAAMAGSHLTACTTPARSSEATEGGISPGSADRIPRVDLQQGPATARAVAELIAAGHVRSAHDCSDGGLLVAAAEMAFAGRVGLDLDLQGQPTVAPLPVAVACFAETPSRYLLEVTPDRLDACVRALTEAGVPFGQAGTFADHDRLTLRTPDEGRLLDASLDDLRTAWQAPLDW